MEGTKRLRCDGGCGFADTGYPDDDVERRCPGCDFGMLVDDKEAGKVSVALVVPIEDVLQALRDAE